LHNKTDGMVAFDWKADGGIYDRDLAERL